MIAHKHGNEEDEHRHRQLYLARKAAIADITSDTAREAAKVRNAGLASSSSMANFSDEDYISNLPEHHLQGYVAVDDDVDDDVEDDGGDDEDDDDENLVGVNDDDVYADEDAEADAQG
jgi:hypothetical protein